MEHDAEDYLSVRVLEAILKNYQLWRELLLAGQMSEDLTMPGGEVINFFDIEPLLNRLLPSERRALITFCLRDEMQIYGDKASNVMGKAKRTGLHKLVAYLTHAPHWLRS